MGNSARGRVTFKRIVYPQYWHLWNHGIIVSCLSVGDREQMEEIKRIIIMANHDCKHFEETTSCVKITKTTINEWERMH